MSAEEWRKEKRERREEILVALRAPILEGAPSQPKHQREPPQRRPLKP
jgi:hypothetical protein